MHPNTAERVRAAAAELGYNPANHDGARRLAYRKHGKRPPTQTIVLFLPGLPGLFSHTAYYPAIFRGIADELAAEHYDLVTRFVDISLTEGKALPNSVVRGDVDATIVFPGELLLSILVDRLRTERSFAARPIVSLLKPAPGCSAVLTDDYGGGYMGAAHLFELGHRHVLHFYPPSLEEGFYYAGQRAAGCRQACRDWGLEPSEHLLSALIDYLLPFPDHVRTPLLDSLAAHPEITAVLAPNDPIAVTIAEILQREGRRIPEDISLVGFDDTDQIFDAQHQNILTSVRLPLEEVGREAAKLAISRATGNSQQDRQITLPVSLVVRRSTAPPGRKPTRGRG